MPTAVAPHDASARAGEQPQEQTDPHCTKLVAAQHEVAASQVCTPQACQTEMYATGLGRPRLNKGDDIALLRKYPATSRSLNLSRWPYVGKRKADKTYDLPWTSEPALFHWQVMGTDWDFRAESLARAKLYYTNTLMGMGAELQRNRRKEKHRERREAYERVEAEKARQVEDHYAQVPADRRPILSGGDPSTSADGHLGPLVAVALAPSAAPVGQLLL